MSVDETPIYLEQVNENYIEQQFAVALFVKLQQSGF